MAKPRRHRALVGNGLAWVGKRGRGQTQKTKPEGQGRQRSLCFRPRVDQGRGARQSSVAEGEMAIHHSIKLQEPDEQIVYRCLTGWPNAITKHLHYRLGALYRTGVVHMKVGITNDPSRRWREAYRHNGWVGMQVVYQSQSHRHVCVLEQLMIKRLDSQLMKSQPYYYNQVGGGGGPKPRAPPYFMYVVTAPSHARITR